MAAFGKEESASYYEKIFFDVVTGLGRDGSIVGPFHWRTT